MVEDTNKCPLPNLLKGGIKQNAEDFKRRSNGNSGEPSWGSCNNDK